MNTTSKKNGWIIVAMSAVAVCTLLLPATRAMSAQVLSSSVAALQTPYDSTTDTNFSTVTGMTTDISLASAGKVMVISAF